MLSAQNPYLRITTAAGKGTTVGYAPMLLWAPPSPLQSSPPAVAHVSAKVGSNMCSIKKGCRDVSSRVGSQATSFHQPC